MVALDRSGFARGPDRRDDLHDPLASLGSEVKRYFPIRIAKDSVGYGFAENILNEQTVPEQLRDEDARQLLSLTNGPFYEMKKKADSRKLDQDRLTRVSHLVGIFKALNILHEKELADKWIRFPNTNRIFAGQTPVEYMIRGGLPAMQTVRRLLDARSGGF
jgi:hypothetical protein